ncbi:hypothetical protein MPL3356_350059 [Mesorhizobium plurifarium]|uniref:DUF6894 domain-containing protein n=1 Tax=Mesorhizobium plurifarium TaxID=69974 RepID=A0A090E2P1_MESPL|nr:hypothetical protein MPL3356_350059 [Mesorhizobium plurifarium]
MLLDVFRRSALTAPRFFFDLSYGGDTYHDAQGMNLRDVALAKQMADNMARKLALEPKTQDVTCTVRDVTGKQVLQISKHG